MAKKKGLNESSKKILSGVNGSLLTITISLIIVGLVFKFGTSLVENHIKSWFDEYVMSMNVAREEGFGLENYDLTKLVGGMSMIFISVGLSSSVVAVLGLLSAKIEMFQIAVLYCVLLGLVILTEIGFILVIAVQRGLIDGSIKPVLIDDLRDGYNGFNGTDSFTQTWNLLMITMDCCGVDDYTDFNGAVTWNRRLYQEGWWFTLSTPVMCCKLGVKVPGDYSCAVNPSETSSNYQDGCYDAAWSVMRNYRSYFILGGSAIFLAQAVLLLAAIIRAKAVFKHAKSKTKTKDVTEQSKPDYGQKSINDLIFNTAGIFGRPNVHSEFQMDPGMPDSWFGQSNTRENRQRPSMTFIQNPGQSALNHLLQQYYLSGRFSHPADLLNPLNMFTSSYPNSYANPRSGPFSSSRDDPFNNIRLDNRFGDIGGIIQPFNPAHPSLAQVQAWNPGVMRLTNQCSIRGLPELEMGTPQSVRRECETSGCLCERNCDPNSRRNSKDIEEGIPLQAVLLLAAIIRAKAVFKHAKSKTKTKDVTEQSKPDYGQKSINDLIFNTAGIFGRPNVHSEFQMDPGMPDSWFGQSNIRENRQRPSMTFIQNPGQSALNHLLQQYYLSGRFSHPADLLNPLNMFTSSYPNSYANPRSGPFSSSRDDPFNNIRLDNRFGDIGGIIQPFNPAHPSLAQVQAWNPGVMRLTNQCSIRGLPELEMGTPQSVRRECETSGCLCERNCDPNSRRNSKDIEEGIPLQVTSQ